MSCTDSVKPLTSAALVDDQCSPQYRQASPANSPTEEAQIPVSGSRGSTGGSSPKEMAPMGGSSPKEGRSTPGSSPKKGESTGGSSPKKGGSTGGSSPKEGGLITDSSSDSSSDEEEELGIKRKIRSCVAQIKVETTR